MPGPDPAESWWLGLFARPISSPWRPYCRLGVSGSVMAVLFAMVVLLLIGQALVIAPGDFWQPKMRDIRFDPEETWVNLLLHARSVDRLDLAGECGAPGMFCPKARMPSDADADERRLLRDSMQLRNAPGQSCASLKGDAGDRDRSKSLSALCRFQAHGPGTVRPEAMPRQRHGLKEHLFPLIFLPDPARFARKETSKECVKTVFRPRQAGRASCSG